MQRLDTIFFSKKTGWMGGGSGHGDGRVRVGWPPMVMMVRQDAVWNGDEGAARGIWSYRSFMAAIGRAPHTAWWGSCAPQLTLSRYPPLLLCPVRSVRWPWTALQSALES